MPSTPDQLIDRRRLLRRLTFWRTLAFMAVALVVVALGWRLMGARGGAGSLVPHIARLSIGGVITGDRETIKLIDDVTDSKAAAAIIIVDSPGGTTAGAERLYNALRRLSAKMPTVCVVTTLAASGGYIAAIGTDHIVAQTTSLVGSIGVLFQFPNVAGALDKIGVKVETIKSAPLKASPNGFEPTSPAAAAAINDLVVDSYAWFKALVKDRRKLDDPQLAAVDDGRVFTGRQGIELHLVDELGEERNALQYLQDKRGIPKSLSVVDWKPSTGFDGLKLFSAVSGSMRLLGFASMADLVDQAGRLAETQSLDGSMAIWQVR